MIAGRPDCCHRRRVVAAVRAEIEAVEGRERHADIVSATQGRAPCTPGALANRQAAHAATLGASMARSRARRARPASRQCILAQRLQQTLQIAWARRHPSPLPALPTPDANASARRAALAAEAAQLVGERGGAPFGSRNDPP